MLFLVNSEFRTILSFVLDYTLEATKAFRAFILAENWCSSRVLIYKQHRPRCSWYTFERKSVCGVQRRHGVSGIPDKFKESLQSPRGQVCVCLNTIHLYFELLRGIKYFSFRGYIEIPRAVSFLRLLV